MQCRLLDFDTSKKTFDQAFVALNIVSQFAGMDPANIDRALIEMNEAWQHDEARC